MNRESSIESQNRRRLQLALALLEKNVREALARNCHGTVGVRVPVHAGKLGQVRQTSETIAGDQG